MQWLGGPLGVQALQILQNLLSESYHSLAAQHIVSATGVCLRPFTQKRETGCPKRG